MQYYLKSEDGKKYLVYEYNSIPEKLYDYKKSRLDPIYIKTKNYTYIPGPIRKTFEMQIQSETSSKIPLGESANLSYKEYCDMIKHVCAMDFGEEKIFSDIDRRKYIESYAKGELSLAHQETCYRWECLKGFPERVDVFKDYEEIRGCARFHVEPLFLFGPDLKVLTFLENGQLNRISFALNHPFIDDQFKCFEFNDEPVDEINIDSLLLISGDNLSNVEAIEKDNSKVLERMGIRVRR